jgi:hypothetical protein
MTRVGTSTRLICWIVDPTTASAARHASSRSRMPPIDLRSRRIRPLLPGRQWALPRWLTFSCCAACSSRTSPMMWRRRESRAATALACWCEARRFTGLYAHLKLRKNRRSGTAEATCRPEASERQQQPARDGRQTPGTAGAHAQASRRICTPSRQPCSRRAGYEESSDCTSRLICSTRAISSCLYSVLFRYRRSERSLAFSWPVDLWNASNTPELARKP